MKKKAYNKYKRTRNDADLLYYREVRKALSTGLKNEKSSFFRWQINKNTSDPCRLRKTFSELRIEN